VTPFRIPYQAAINCLAVVLSIPKQYMSKLETLMASLKGMIDEIRGKKANGIGGYNVNVIAMT
jgi:hypothetical protein